MPMDLVDFERVTRPMLGGAIDSAVAELRSIDTHAQAIERLLVDVLANQEKIVNLLSSERKDKDKDKPK